MAKIVCIEDEGQIRVDVADELRDAGHDVIEAVNGRDGLESILEHDPDVVVCDCLMPIMTGIELLATLRRDHPRFDDLSIVFPSAHADKNHVKAGKDLGAHAYLTKPVDFGLLVDTVEALLASD